ncbi:hypothetical protein [Ornithinibacillus halophilus]|uniref:Uncharacterized protein n=1 Tax=Ornithinibacillus halophilus TaxID=930117 RepID=A0A1M5FSN6_9BACI|nr:hypothetical protein [Ornithinibacillus halophilus]SHF94486.1 hypothetical protein SAMN05216225_10106 [Ornithinibacillus halophilus]
MWIRSQNRKELVNCISYTVRKNIGGKNEALVGTVDNGFWGRKEIILGMYDTTEIAIAELTKIQEALIEKVELYEMN